MKTLKNIKKVVTIGLVGVSLISSANANNCEYKALQTFSAIQPYMDKISEYKLLGEHNIKVSEKQINQSVTIALKALDKLNKTCGIDNTLDLADMLRVIKKTKNNVEFMKVHNKNIENINRTEDKIMQMCEAGKTNQAWRYFDKIRKSKRLPRIIQSDIVEYLKNNCKG